MKVLLAGERWHEVTFVVKGQDVSASSGNGTGGSDSVAGSRTSSRSLKERNIDGVILNHRDTEVSGSVDIKHNKAKKGPQKDFEVVPRSSSGENHSHKEEIKNLPKMGGEYTVTVEIDNGMTASRSLPVGKAEIRGKICVILHDSEVKIGRQSEDRITELIPFTRNLETSSSNKYPLDSAQNIKGKVDKIKINEKSPYWTCHPACFECWMYKSERISE